MNFNSPPAIENRQKKKFEKEITNNLDAINQFRKDYPHLNEYSNEKIYFIITDELN